MLELKENGSYTEVLHIGIPNVNQMDTQVRLGKVSIGKDSISIVLKKYEEEIGFATPTTVTILDSYLTDNDLSEEMIIKAIEIASERNKKNLSYIKGILNSWIAKGYRVLADIENEKQTKTKSNIEEVWSE